MPDSFTSLKRWCRTVSHHSVISSTQKHPRKTFFCKELAFLKKLNLWAFGDEFAQMFNTGNTVVTQSGILESPTTCTGRKSNVSFSDVCRDYIWLVSQKKITAWHLKLTDIKKNHFSTVPTECCCSQKGWMFSVWLFCSCIKLCFLCWFWSWHNKNKKVIVITQIGGSHKCFKTDACSPSKRRQSNCRVC